LRGWQLASFGLFFGLWELTGRWPISAAFPPFSTTFLALLEMLRDGSLGKAYLITAQPLLLGVALCGLAGIAFGIGMGLSRTVEWLSLPVFIILQAAPMAAIIPLLTYMYGIGLTSKVLAVIMLAAPVIVMNSYKGIRNTPPSLLQMCRSFQGSRRQEVVKIVLPHAAALIFTGLRLGLGYALIVAVAVEIVAASRGLGALLWLSWQVLKVEDMYATFFVIAVLGGALSYGLAAARGRLLPWVQDVAER